MDMKSEVLIREIAEKLGSTGEQLWLVLIRQAPITATLQLLVLVTFLYIAYRVYKLLKRETTTPTKTNEDKFPCPELEDEDVVLLWRVWVIVTLILIIITVALLPSIVTAFVNPEYWALKHLLP